MKQYWACQKNNELKMSSKIKTTGEALNLTFGTLQGDDNKTTCTPLGSKRPEAEEKFKHLKIQLSNQIYLKQHANQDIETELLDWIEGEIELNKEARKTFAEQVLKNPEYALQWNSESILASEKRVQVCQMILSLIRSENKISPVEALRKVEERLTNDLLSNKYSGGSSSAFTNAIERIQQKVTSTMVLGYDQRSYKWFLFKAENRKDARIKLNLPPMDCDK